MKCKWILQLILFFNLANFLAMPLAMARELVPFYSSVRCQGMGGACLAVVNDETALLVNPAALGKLRDFYGTFFDPEIEVSNRFQTFYYSGGFSDPFSLSGIATSLDQNRSLYYHAKYQMFPSFVGRNFGIGLFYNNLLNAQASSDGTTIDAYYRADTAVVTGFNFRLFNGRMKLGFNLKAIDRIEIDNTAIASNASLSNSSLASGGLGLGGDIGLILTAPYQFLPTLSAVIKDVGSMKFDRGASPRLSTVGRPNTQVQSIDVAAAIFPIHTNGIRSSITIETRDITNALQVDDKAKLMHSGFEVNFYDQLFVRGGYNQRYLTGGFELASDHFQWQLSTYGEEVGTPGAQKEDRRYTIKFAYRY